MLEKFLGGKSKPVKSSESVKPTKSKELPNRLQSLPMESRVTELEGDLRRLLEILSRDAGGSYKKELLEIQQRDQGVFRSKSNA